MDQITPAQLAERLQQPEHPALLDVREPDEHGIVALPGGAVLVAWLLGAAVRVGHVASDLRRAPPLTPASFPGPSHDRQRVGAAGE